MGLTGLRRVPLGAKFGEPFLNLTLRVRKLLCLLGNRLVRLARLLRRPRLKLSRLGRSLALPWWRSRLTSLRRGLTWLRAGRLRIVLREFALPLLRGLLGISFGGGLRLRFTRELSQCLAGFLLSSRGLVEIALLQCLGGRRHLLLRFGSRKSTDVGRQFVQLLSKVRLLLLQPILLLTLRAAFRCVRLEFLIKLFRRFLNLRLLFRESSRCVSNFGRVLRLSAGCLCDLSREVGIGVCRIVRVGGLTRVGDGIAIRILAGLTGFCRFRLKFLFEPLQRIRRVFLSLRELVESLLNLLGIRSLRRGPIRLCRIESSQLPVQFGLLLQRLPQLLYRLLFFLLSPVTHPRPLQLIAGCCQLVCSRAVRRKRVQLVALGELAVLLRRFALLSRKLLNITRRPLTTTRRLHRLGQLIQSLARLLQRLRGLLRILLAAVPTFGERFGRLPDRLLSRVLLTARRRSFDRRGSFCEFLFLFCELLQRRFVARFQCLRRCLLQRGLLTLKLLDLLLRSRLTLQPIFQSGHRLLKLPLRSGNVRLPIRGEVVDRRRRRFDRFFLLGFRPNRVQLRELFRDESLLTGQSFAVRLSRLFSRLRVRENLLRQVILLNVLDFAKLSQRVLASLLVGWSRLGELSQALRRSCTFLSYLIERCLSRLIQRRCFLSQRRRVFACDLCIPRRVRFQKLRIGRRLNRLFVLPSRMQQSPQSCVGLVQRGLLFVAGGLRYVKLRRGPLQRRLVYSKVSQFPFAFCGVFSAWLLSRLFQSLCEFVLSLCQFRRRLAGVLRERVGLCVLNHPSQIVVGFLLEFSRLIKIALFQFIDNLLSQFRIDRRCHAARIGQLRVGRLGEFFKLLRDFLLSRHDFGRTQRGRVGVFLQRLGEGRLRVGDFLHASDQILKPTELVLPRDVDQLGPFFQQALQSRHQLVLFLHQLSLLIGECLLRLGQLLGRLGSGNVARVNLLLKLLQPHGVVCKLGRAVRQTAELNQIFFERGKFFESRFQSDETLLDRVRFARVRLQRGQLAGEVLIGRGAELLGRRTERLFGIRFQLIHEVREQRVLFKFLTHLLQPLGERCFAVGQLRQFFRFVEFFFVVHVALCATGQQVAFVAAGSDFTTDRPQFFPQLILSGEQIIRALRRSVVSNCHRVNFRPHNVGFQNRSLIGDANLKLKNVTVGDSPVFQIDPELMRGGGETQLVGRHAKNFVEAFLRRGVKFKRPDCEVVRRVHIQRVDVVRSRFVVRTAGNFQRRRLVARDQNLPVRLPIVGQVVPVRQAEQKRALNRRRQFDGRRFPVRRQSQFRLDRIAESHQLVDVRADLTFRLAAVALRFVRLRCRLTFVFRNDHRSRPLDRRSLDRLVERHVKLQAAVLEDGDRPRHAVEIAGRQPDVTRWRNLQPCGLDFWRIDDFDPKPLRPRTIGVDMKFEIRIRVGNRRVERQCVRIETEVAEIGLAIGRRPVKRCRFRNGILGPASPGNLRGDGDVGAARDDAVAVLNLERQRPDARKICQRLK